jgi:diadenosine tetraphosphate (Ap4A) HIT family hydrolase
MSWNSPELWQHLKDGSACPMCADAHLPENEFSVLIADLRQSHVRLARNQYARGWVIVVARRHVCELHEMSPAELAGYCQDVADAALALSRVYSPIKINYMIFGNIVPHVHCHLYPRFADQEPTHHPFMDTDRFTTLLEPSEYSRLLENLRAALPHRS